MKPKQIREALSHTFDTLRFVKKENVWVGRLSFFYRHGCNETKLAAEVCRRIPGATILEAKEYWNSWPRDSYWRVEFMVDPAPPVRIVCTNALSEVRP